MSSISGYGNYNSSFDPSSDNDGEIVSGDMYEGVNKTSRDISNSIMSQIGGGKAYGFNLADIVNTMVQGDMMDEIPGLQRQITNTNVKISAIGKLESLMGELKKTTLAPTEAGLSPYSVQSSDPNDILVTEDSNSANTPNIQPFTVNVTSVAKTDAQLFSQGEVSPNTAISGTGDLSIQLGSGDPVAITIADNSSLSDIASQINQSSANVTASVVQQSDGYHLAITSNDSGAKNAITFGFTGSNSDLKTLMDNHNVMQAAADAQYSINGISMTSASNNIEFQGVSLLLNKDNTSATISAKTDTSNISQSVTQFVHNYNELVTEINKISSPTTGKEYRGALYQDQDIDAVKTQLSNVMMSVLSNGNALANLGIDYNRDGTLSLNQSQLFSQLDSNPKLADNILSTHMNATNNYIEPIGYNKTGNSALAATTSGTYDVNITQVAEAAKLSSVGTLNITGGNNVRINNDVTMDVTVTGIPHPGKFEGDTETVANIKVDIPSGNYTKTELAQKIQDEINHATGVTSKNAGVAVKIDDSGHLQITSESMGSQTGFTINSGDSSNLNELGLSGSNLDSAHNGKDVEGTINNQLCFGEGQYLEAQDDETNGDDASGFVIKFKGQTTGSMGTVTLSKGYSEQLDDLLTGLTYTSATDPNSSGLLALKTHNYQDDLNPNHLNSLIDQLKEAKAKQDQLTQMYFDRYKDVNSTLSKMSGMSEYIDQMFSGNK